jgi:hypothetical protein
MSYTQKLTKTEIKRNKFLELGGEVSILIGGAILFFIIISVAILVVEFIMTAINSGNFFERLMEENIFLTVLGLPIVVLGLFSLYKGYTKAVILSIATSSLTLFSPINTIWNNYIITLPIYGEVSTRWLIFFAFIGILFVIGGLYISLKYNGIRKREFVK